jgi:fructose-1,6-bisphosphatase I
MEGTVHHVTWSYPAVKVSTDSPSTRYVSSDPRPNHTNQQSLGEFILTHPEIKIPSRGKIYSFNEGNSQHFYPPTNEYLNSIKFPSSNKPYSARYIGSMVADVHRTLLYGGIFGYPDDKKSKDGKLRMLYEAFPMSFLIEQVGLHSLCTWR